jgi:thioredoxin-related protein
MTNWVAILLFPTLFLAGGSALASPPKGYPFVAFDEGLRLAKQQSKPVFLYFGRFGCAWCDQVNKQTFVDPGLRELYTRNYVLVYVDAESGKRLRLPSGERITEADLGVRYKAFATPLFLFLEADGKEIARIPGIQTVENFRDYDRFVMEGHYRTQTLVEFLRGKP